MGLEAPVNRLISYISGVMWKASSMEHVLNSASVSLGVLEGHDVLFSAHTERWRNLADLRGFA